ncbi:MAG: hypothetical protein CFE43_08300 [Burkholderiales bacterium PBB3]|nr:MAG: hypothetical protein CFE43_08300 [Burkholderiales bacterium PBB3]
MKNLAIVVMMLAAVATLPAHAAFNEKACMKKCTKHEAEKVEKRNQEERAGKEDSRVKGEKADKQEVRKLCEFICKDNPDNPN